MRRACSLASDLFSKVSIATNFLDAQLLLAFAINKAPLYIHLEPHRELSNNEFDIFFDLVARRLCHEPVAYLIGEKEFFGLPFFVSKDSLIPRPDTEVIVEKCLEKIDLDSQDLIFDLCCGSGIIGISLLKERKHLRCLATDICENALSLARKNADHLGVSARFDTGLGDLFDAVPPSIKAKLIVTNPPYISSLSIPILPRSVRDYEPHLALNGGLDGLSFYKKILHQAADYLLPQGFLVMEIGFDQKDALKTLLGTKWCNVVFFSDLAGLDRGIVLQKR